MRELSKTWVCKQWTVAHEFMAYVPEEEYKINADSHSAETKHICSKNNLLHVCTHNCFTSWYDLVIVSVNDALPSIKVRRTPRRNVHSSRYAGGVSNRQTINHMWRTFLGANMLWTPCQAENRFLNIAITPPYTLLIICHVAVETAKFNMIIIYVTRWAKIWHILHFKNEIGPDIVLVTIDRASVQTSKWSAAQFPRYSHKHLLIMKNYISSKCNVFTLLRYDIFSAYYSYHVWA